MYADPNTAWLIMVFIAAAAGATMAAAYVLAEALGLVRRGLSQREKIAAPDMNAPLLRAFLPAARTLGSLLRVILGGARRPEAGVNQALAALDRRLSGAGRPQGLRAGEYVGFMVLIAALGAMLGAGAHLWLAPNAYLPLPGYLIGGAALAGMWWWSWLTRKRRGYRLDIQRELPFCLDLLTLSIEAGLDFTAALSRIVRKIGGGALGREFAYMLREIQLGKARAEALRAFSRRVDVPEVGAVVASLVQAEELGASLGPVLRILAAQQRERRSQRAEEQAMKAPVKILAPLVICLFPSILIMIGGPIVIALMMNS